MWKRGFDLTLAAVGLVLLAPVFILVWAAIKIDDGGPVFFLQIRVGLKGRQFRIIKFRTMCVGGERLGPGVTVAGDRRITKTGRFLRKTKLDELPQLWNVIAGEMSFVGPRPELPMYVALYTQEQRKVLDIKPGITDEASIAFRDEEYQLSTATNPERFYIESCMPRKIEFNLAYARRANMFRDLLTIVRTVRKVWLSRRLTASCRGSGFGSTL